MYRIFLVVGVTVILGLGWASGCSPRIASSFFAGPDQREKNAWFATGREAVRRASSVVAGEPPARNVILFVGDGMGISTITAARILEGQRRGQNGEENSLAFEHFPNIALSKTYSADAQVSDSASTMTAMVAGVKTRTAVLGLDETISAEEPDGVDAARVISIMEEAESYGLATGIVTTTSVTHATPAACYAHAPFRLWENDSELPGDARALGFPDIARQLLEFPYGDGIDVVLGGGRKHFLPNTVMDPELKAETGARSDGRDLTAEWVSRREGAAYVWNSEALDGLDLTGIRYLLGLFEFEHMQWDSERDRDVAGEPSLAEMTATAIEILSRNDKGFVLVVEGGRIDHGHHAGSAVRALNETIAMSDAVRRATDLTDPDETMIVVTADHSHAFTIAGYPKRGNPILGLVVGAGFFNEAGKTTKDELGLPYTTLSYANGPGYTGASGVQPEGWHQYLHDPCSSEPPYECDVQGIGLGRPDLSLVDTTSDLFLQEATVPLRKETHAGEDVPIYATGPRAGLFFGVREQHYVYHAMVEALGWTEGGEPLRR